MSGNDEIEARVRHDIAHHGWHLVMVPAEGDAPGWAHTIGLYERFGHPELIAFGSDLEMLGPLVNALGTRVSAGTRFEAETAHEGVLEGYRVAFRSVAAKWVGTFLGNAAWHYQREDFPVVQAFWPDPGGFFPWEPGHDETWRHGQPRLEHTETHRALSEPMIRSLRDEGAL